MSEEMTPQERTARIMGLFREQLAVLPTPFDGLRLTREQLEEREAKGREYGAEITALARGEDDQTQD